MTYHYANLRYSDSILRKGHTNIIYLTDNPHDISKQHLIYIISDQIADTLIWLNYQKYHNIYKLNHVLTRSIQQVNNSGLKSEACNSACQKWWTE